MSALQFRLADEPRRGRPREKKVDDAIFKAAYSLFVEKGYHATRMMEIARRAGVGTPAVYRRWPDKASLAVEVLSHTLGEVGMQDTDSLRADLLQLMTSRLRVWRTPIFQSVLVPLMSESAAKPDVRRRIAERFVVDMTSQRARVQRAIDEGELKPMDPQVILDMLGGPIAVPLMFHQGLPEESEAEAIVDALLSGIASDKAAERS